MVTQCPDECDWLQLLQTVEGFCLHCVFHPQVVAGYLERADWELCKLDLGFPLVTIANANQAGMMPSQPKFGWEGFSGTTILIPSTIFLI